VTAIALALAMGVAPQGQQPPSWYKPWRLVETDTVHFAVRPGFLADTETQDGSWEVGVGATAQLTAYFISL
jgi:hypothetical protein